MSLGGSYYELDKPVVYGVHEGELACAAVASGADTVLDLQTLFPRAWAQDYLTVYLDATPGAICTWALNNTGATVAAAGAFTARRAERILSKGRRYLVLRMVSGTGTIRAWGSSVSPLSAPAAINPFIDFSAVFDLTLDFTGTLDDATPGAFDDFTANFTMSMGLEPLSLDAGVALPTWTTGGASAVGYAADHPTLTALSAGTVVTSVPPMDGTGGTFGESVGGGNHVTYQPTQLDSLPTLVFDGTAGNGVTYSGASAPVSYASGNDLPITVIVRGRFTGAAGQTGHLFGFGNSASQDPFWHAGTSGTDLWQFRKRAGAAGGGTGPQVVTSDTTVHTFVVNADGAVADMALDGSAIATNVAQNEASTTFDRVSLGTLHRNTTPPAGKALEGRRWIFANVELNATDVTNGSLWVQTSAVYAARTRLKALLIGSSTAAGFGPVTSYLELLTATYDLELFDLAINGLETAEARATGSTQEPWAPAVLTSNNITAGLAACPNPDLVIYHVNTDVATGFDAYEAHGSWPGGTTFVQFLQTYAIPYIQEVQTAVEALGAEFVVSACAQPADAPTSPYPLTTYSQRRADADVQMRAAFGLKYWDRLRTLMLDTGDGSCLPGLLQGDNNHPTGATHILIAAELAAHIRERCPRSAPYFLP